MLKIRQIIRLFPAYIRIDARGVISAAGPFFDRYLEEDFIGIDFFEIFSCQTHWRIEAFEKIPELGEPIRLKHSKSDVLLQGLVVPIADGYFFGVNLIPTADAITKGQLQIDDFGLGDPLASGLMSIIMQQASLDDARKSAQALAIEQERTSALLHRISRMAGYVAHDFNNFLSIIELNCDLLLQDHEVNARLIPKLQMIKDTAQRTSETTYSLMTLAKLKYDSRSLIDVDDLVENNISFLRTVAGPNIDLQFELGSFGSLVYVAKGALLNSLINLVINSRDSVEGKGRVVVSTQAQRIEFESDGSIGATDNVRHVCISVNDTGSGMTKEVASHAFEPLFSTKARGNGMGLASVREFCREMGGDASLLTVPNVGTTVTLYLPLVAISPPGSSPVESSRCLSVQESEAQSAEKVADLCSVLVVEDEPYARDALKETLENLGLRVAAAGSAVEAIGHLERGRYDFLLADVTMPGMSGIELARWVEQHDLVDQIVLMSGQLPASEQLGSSWRFIRKPLNELRIRDVLELARKP